MNLRDLTCTHDLDGTILSLNAAAAQLLGCTADELVGKNLRDILAPAARAGFTDYIESIVRDGAAEGAMTVLSRDGEHRVWEFHNHLRTDGVVSPIVEGVAFDVTERENAIRALRDSEEQFRTIIENVSDLITIIDTDGVLRYATPSTQTMVGRAPEEVVGRSFFELIHPDDVDYAASTLGRDDGDGSEKVVEMRFVHSNGTPRVAEVISKSLTRNGRVTGVIATTRDITDRRMLESQLERAHRLSSLGRLAATVAHEFNNVLMGMQPFAELISRPGVSEATIAKSAWHLTNSIARGKRIVQDILRFTQPAEPSLRPLDLGQWWNTLLPEAGALTLNNVRMVSDFPPESLQVLADASQLTQVVMNLVSNARDAMPKGGTLTIRARRPSAGATFPFAVVSHPESFIHLSVADTGEGIPKEMLHQIFEPLFTSKPSGTGLGLAVAHQVVARHGGQIYVESAPGSGTTFHIFLPAPRGRQALLPVDSTETGESACPPQVRSRKLLMIEDEPVIVEGISALLRESHFEVSSVACGEEAVDAVEKFEPDVVLLDVGLPGIDGIETHRRIRNCRPSLPIIFSSGHDAGVVASDERTQSLQKPFSLSALFDAIAALETAAA
jgi:PAS domain S-box-containing protein